MGVHTEHGLVVSSCGVAVLVRVRSCKNLLQPLSKNPRVVSITLWMCVSLSWGSNGVVDRIPPLAGRLRWLSVSTGQPLCFKRSSTTPRAESSCVFRGFDGSTSSLHVCGREVSDVFVVLNSSPLPCEESAVRVLLCV